MTEITCSRSCDFSSGLHLRLVHHFQGQFQVRLGSGGVVASLWRASLRDWSTSAWNF